MCVIIPAAAGSAREDRQARAVTGRALLHTATQRAPRSAVPTGGGLGERDLRAEPDAAEAQAGVTDRTAARAAPPALGLTYGRRAPWRRGGGNGGSAVSRSREGSARRRGRQPEAAAAVPAA